MIEIRKEVRTIQVECMCPKCKEGHMIAIGTVMRDTNPPDYPHKCNKCGHVEIVSNKRYPQMEYEYSQPIIAIREISKVQPLMNLKNPVNPENPPE